MLEKVGVWQMRRRRRGGHGANRSMEPWKSPPDTGPPTARPSPASSLERCNGGCEWLLSTPCRPSFCPPFTVIKRPTVKTVRLSVRGFSVTNTRLRLRYLGRCCPNRPNLIQQLGLPTKPRNPEPSEPSSSRWLRCDHCEQVRQGISLGPRD
jgi:hypothetical protein